MYHNCKHKLRSLDYRPLKRLHYKLVFFCISQSMVLKNEGKEKENISLSIHHHREKMFIKERKIRT